MRKQITRARIRTALGVALLACLLAFSATASNAYPRPGETERASVSSDGVPAVGDNVALSPSINATGRFVAFLSMAPNLVIPDTNPGLDVFVHDRKTGQTDLVSVSSAGIQGVSGVVGSNDSIRPEISASGRYVVFNTTAALVSDDTSVCKANTGASGPCPDVYVHDRKTKETKRVSLSNGNEQGNDGSMQASISDDGRYVVFTSYASNLVPNDTNNEADIFMRDLKEGTTSLISLASNGDQIGGSCAVIDATGNYVAFAGQGQIQLRNLRSGKTEMVSVSSDGTPSAPTGTGCGQATGLDISAGGRYVAFTTSSDNLVPNDSHPAPRLNLYIDVFVHDRESGRTQRVSVTSQGEQTEEGNSGAWFLGTPGQMGLSISGSGRYVAFASNAKNLFPGDREIPNGSAPYMGDLDVFVHDMRTGATELASIDTAGQDGVCGFIPMAIPELQQPLQGSESGQAENPSISRDGSYIAFASCDKDLVAGEESGDSDISAADAFFHILVRDRGVAVSAKQGGTAPEAGSEDQLCITPEFCLPPQGFVSIGNPAVAEMPSDADLVGASIAFRPEQRDVFVVQELEDLQSLEGAGVITSTVGQAPYLYGLHFTAQARDYEVRATSLLGGTFGLFNCTNSGSTCRKVADLKGGFGTTGERVVFSIPLDEIGLGSGGKLYDFEAFTSLGVYDQPLQIQDRQILDRVVFDNHP